MHSYGGFWIRVLAYIIDVFILQFASTLVSFLGFGTAFASADIGAGGESIVWGTMILVYGFILLGNWLYFAILESSRWQGTLGKQALKLIVTDEHGERISFGRASGRYFAKFLSSLIVIGFMMVGWTRRKQGLHDFVAGTLVYRADSPNLARNSASVFE